MQELSKSSDTGNKDRVSTEWQELSRKTVFKKYSRAMDRVRFSLPDGHEEDFYIMSIPKTVCILALNSDKSVITVRQFRPGPKLVMNELPGGFVDEGESTSEAARRELLEETGYNTAKIEQVGSCYDDAYSTGIRTYFVATDCKKIAEPITTKNEHTEVRLMTQKDFRELLRSGNMTDIEIGYLCLDYLGLL